MKEDPSKSVDGSPMKDLEVTPVEVKPASKESIEALPEMASMPGPIEQ